MPKPRTEAREQRRIARDLARRQAITAVEYLLSVRPGSLPQSEFPAYDAEVRRIVERMRLQYRLRADLAHCPALARGDTPGADEPS